MLNDGDNVICYDCATSKPLTCISFDLTMLLVMNFAV